MKNNAANLETTMTTANDEAYNDAVTLATILGYAVTIIMVGAAIFSLLN